MLKTGHTPNLYKRHTGEGKYRAMHRMLRFSISFAAAAALTAGIALADGAPIRHLVYKFDVRFTTTSTVHSSGFVGDGPASGTSDLRMGSDDDGTITVDVLQVQPDSGLVLRISEQARLRRSAQPTLCVVYGTGSTICDQSHGEMNEEEMTLMRFLGRNFVNTSVMDAKRHWQYASTAPRATETSNYTLDKADANVMNISYQRQLKVTGAQPFEATTEGSLSYNDLLSMPVSINEDTVTRKNGMGGNADKIEQKIDLSLASDSMQTAQSH